MDSDRHRVVGERERKREKESERKNWKIEQIKPIGQKCTVHDTKI